ncbi:hypothetical protein ASE13_05660 [Sphingomonas sp. Root241]|nr:hypothetical protein ASE13_05660 [Sphingomonas sp. Root241]
MRKVYAVLRMGVRQKLDAARDLYPDDIGVWPGRVGDNLGEFRASRERRERFEPDRLGMDRSAVNGAVEHHHPHMSSDSISSIRSWNCRTISGPMILSGGSRT